MGRQTRTVQDVSRRELTAPNRSLSTFAWRVLQGITKRNYDRARRAQQRQLKVARIPNIQTEFPRFIGGRVDRVTLTSARDNMKPVADRLGWSERGDLSGERNLIDRPGLNLQLDLQAASAK